jgi:hypothetical protein
LLTACEQGDLRSAPGRLRPADGDLGKPLFIQFLDMYLVLNVYSFHTLRSPSLPRLIIPGSLETFPPNNDTQASAFPSCSLPLDPNALQQQINVTAFLPVLVRPLMRRPHDLFHQQNMHVLASIPRCDHYFLDPSPLLFPRHLQELGELHENFLKP